MDSSYLIIALSLSVLVSYGFDLLSGRFKMQSVILLLGLGIGLRQLTDYLAIQVPYVTPALATLGALGLILIVLEGSLDLELEPGNYGLLRRTSLMAFLTIALTTLVIATTLYLLLEETFYKCLINAIPFAVVSSAVVLPSVRNLTDGQRSFVVYESSFSDIMGVMVFNFVLMSQTSVLTASGIFVRDTLAMAVISLVCCFGLLYLIGRISHPVKFLPIISVLFLVYAVAKIYQLSSLLLILVFGLFLNNTELFMRGRLNEIFKNDLFEKELDQLKNLTTEGAFVVRTFFFLLFGFAADVQSLIDPDALIVSAIFVIVIVAVRALALRFTLRGPLGPLVWIAPRGLLTILLYREIPESLQLTGFPAGILIVVVILSSLAMTAGGLGNKPVVSE
ncbi:MAG: sodium:proton exchanger [Bacteroidetes bacterium]|nr:sodium:proton exchanger [Fibrella sp.]